MFVRILAAIPSRETPTEPLSTGNWKEILSGKLRSAAHVMAPTLTSLLFMGASSAVAHAQGTISFSGAQTFMQTVQTFAEYAGAVICLIGLIFAGVSFMSGNIQRGVIGLFGAIFGAGVLGWGAGWISSLTGQSVS